MRKLKKYFDKRYIASCVVAAFLILSVLTAYNINTGKEPPEETEQVEETIGQKDAARSGTDETQEDEDDGSKISRKAGNADGEDADEEDADEDADDGDDKDADEETDDTKDDGDDSDTDDEDDEAEDDEEDADEKDDDDTDDGESDAKTAADTSADGTQYIFDEESTLDWPLVGNILIPYSMDTTTYYTTLDQYACNDGIVIGAKVGDEVTAAADGRVVNISESDKYGTTLTMLIGKYYEVSYSQIEDIRYEIGDEVKRGDVIATVAEPSRSFTEEGPNLFFKMTWKGDPVNPSGYFA